MRAERRQRPGRPRPGTEEGGSSRTSPPPFLRAWLRRTGSPPPRGLQGAPGPGEIASRRAAGSPPSMDHDDARLVGGLIYRSRRRRNCLPSPAVVCCPVHRQLGIPILRAQSLLADAKRQRFRRFDAVPKSRALPHGFLRRNAVSETPWPRRDGPSRSRTTSGVRRITIPPRLV